MKTLGPINWDFGSMSMSFCVGKVKMSLQGLNFDNVNVQPGNNCLKSSLVRKQGWFLQLMAVEAV